jgi:hypothetical protein
VCAASTAAVLVMAPVAGATPSTQVWIPSTDTQPARTLHLGVDNYTTLFKKSEDGGWSAPTDFGATVGLADTPHLGFEAGVDIREQSDFPLSFNVKLQVKEDSLFQYFPAIAVGGYEFGSESDVTNYNIVYGLIAKTAPVVGRVTIGYYVGNDKLLTNAAGESENTGPMASWDRTLAEIDDRLWVCVDYMGGANAFGALSFGVAWRFSPHIGALIGYDVYNDNEVAGENTATVQFDIDF